MLRTSPKPGPEVTIDDVALEAGVSIRTVSRVLNKSPKVNAETRGKIEEVMARLDYRPNWRARGLATGRSYLLGLLHDEHNALVLGEVLRGVVPQAAERGYEIIVHPAATTDDDPVRDAVDFVLRSRVDGLLIMSPASGVEGLAEALRPTGVTTCALSAVAIDGFDSTLVYDERAGAAQAAQHLIDLGHRRIAVMSGPNFISARERRAGFIETLRKAGIEPAAEVQGDYGFESGVAGAERLLGLAPRPTAILAASDAMAAGILKVAATKGISVPRDLSVVGYDYLLAPMLTPALTAVHRPMRELAGDGVARLIDLIEELPPAPDFHAGIELVLGKSTAPPSK
jgi:LacI family transcriptional regulator